MRAPPEHPRVDPPRFCPGCRRPRRADERLCPECGEASRPQGYCPTCERYWPLEAGEPCPKHDLPLDDEAPPPPVPGDVPADGWVTVGRYGNPIEAEARRIRLEAEGIPTFLDGARMGTNTLYEVATGGIKLQVPRGLEADARVVLTQSWAPPVEDDDLDDAWEDLAPAPGSALLDAALRVVAVVGLAGLLLAALVAVLKGATR